MGIANMHPAYQEGSRDRLRCRWLPRSVAEHERGLYAKGWAISDLGIRTWHRRHPGLVARMYQDMNRVKRSAS